MGGYTQRPPSLRTVVVYCPPRGPSLSHHSDRGLARLVDSWNTGTSKDEHYPVNWQTTGPAASLETHAPIPSALSFLSYLSTYSGFSRHNLGLGLQREAQDSQSHQESVLCNLLGRPLVGVTVF